MQGDSDEGEGGRVTRSDVLLSHHQHHDLDSHGELTNQEEIRQVHG